MNILTEPVAVALSESEYFRRLNGCPDKLHSVVLRGELLHRVPPNTPSLLVTLNNLCNTYNCELQKPGWVIKMVVQHLLNRLPSPIGRHEVHWTRKRLRTGTAEPGWCHSSARQGWTRKPVACASFSFHTFCHSSAFVKIVVTTERLHSLILLLC